MVRVYDNTRLSTGKSCLRRYYFRHERNWTGEGTSAALAYGAAWHSAMEVVWPLMCDDKLRTLEEMVHKGHAAFLIKWEELGMPASLTYEEEQELAPRTPSRAFEMLVEYVSERIKHIEDMELLTVERPFIVPLGDYSDGRTVYYVGKIDKVVRRRGKILGIEHKTTTAYSKSAGFRSAFLDSFNPNSQIDGYLFVLHLTFPGEVGGVWVDAALVHKQETAFQYVPVEKQMDMLDAWLFETRYWVDMIEKEKAKLALVSPDDKYMTAFPRNTNDCFNFNVSCPYLDCCRAWPNPVGQPMPPGMKEEVWDPLKEIPGVEALLANER